MKWVILFFSIITVSNVGALDLDTVLQSTIRHYPKIKSSLLEYQYSSLSVTKSLGEFDSKLKIENKDWASGYYDANINSIRIEKPLGSLGSTISLGHQKSSGLIPIYQEEFKTLSDGEFFLKLQFELLRNRSIDQNRLKLTNSKVKEQLQLLQLQLQQIEILRSARIAYAKLIASALNVDTYKALLDLALQRQKAIRIKVKKGDLAKIYLTENMQYIAKRKVALTKAWQKFYSSAQYFSLFYRDQLGRPIVPSKNQLQSDLSRFYRKDSLQENPKTLKEVNQYSNIDFKIVLDRSPHFKIYSFKATEQENIVHFKKNQILPKLTVKLGTAKNIGNGAKSLEEVENTVSLNLEVPIERRKLKSDLEISKIKLKQVQLSQKLFRDKFFSEFKILQLKMQANEEALKSISDEINYATTLEKAERVKFDQGASDFFVLNLREQNRVDAQIKNIQTQLELNIAKAFYDELIFDNSYQKYLLSTKTADPKG